MAKLSPNVLMFLGVFVMVISVVVNGWSLLGPMSIFLIIGLFIMLWGIFRAATDKGKVTQYKGDQEYEQMKEKPGADQDPDEGPHQSEALRTTRHLMAQQETKQRAELQQQYGQGLSGYQQRQVPPKHINAPPGHQQFQQSQQQQQRAQPQQRRAPVQHMPQKHCMKCKNPIHPKVRYCPHCGNPAA